MKNEIIKIKKCNKVASNLYNKKENVGLIRPLKQALKHRLILKKYIKQFSLIKELG